MQTKFTCKVMTTKTWPQLEGICEEGEILDLYAILYEEDTILMNEIWRPIDLDDHKKGKYKMSDAVIAPKGSFKEFVVRKEGKTDGGWDNVVIRNAIGYRNSEGLFKKIEDANQD